MKIRFGCNDSEFKKSKVYVYCDPRYSRNEGYEYEFEGGALRLKSKPFYIGCAKYNGHLRHLTGSKSSELVQKRIKKIRESELEPIIKILKFYSFKKKAYKIEEVLIIGIGRQDLKTGPLLNKLDGYRNLSPKTYERMRRRVGKASKKIWEDLEYRKKMSEKGKESWKNSKRRKDMSERMRGERNLNSKFTEKKAVEMRKLKGKGWSPFGLAKKYKVSRSCIYHVLARHTWDHI